MRQGWRTATVGTSRQVLSQNKNTAGIIAQFIAELPHDHHHGPDLDTRMAISRRQRTFIAAPFIGLIYAVLFPPLARDQ